MLPGLNNLAFDVSRHRRPDQLVRHAAQGHAQLHPGRPPCCRPSPGCCTSAPSCSSSCGRQGRPPRPRPPPAPPVRQERLRLTASAPRPSAPVHRRTATVTPGAPPCAARPLALAAALALPAALALHRLLRPTAPPTAPAGDAITVKATDTACEVSRTDGPGRHGRVHGHQRRQQGQRVLRLRRGRPDHRRGREHRPRPDPHLPRRPARAGHLPDRLQAGHGRRRHPRRRSPSPGPRPHRRATDAERSPPPSPSTSATSRAQSDALLARTDGVRRRCQGRQGRRGQGALPDRPLLLGADRAGRRVVRRPRPEDRRPRRGRRRRAWRSPATTASRRTCGSTACSPTPRPSPTSCSPTSRSSSTKAKAVELTPLQLANGSKALLDEIATGKITGEEERYSHTDLWDFEANFEGSQAAIAGAAPVPRGAGPGPGRDHRRASPRPSTTLLETLPGGDGFVLYPALTPADIKALTDGARRVLRAGRQGGRGGGPGE